jgi:hypothetical protein
MSKVIRLTETSQDIDGCFGRCPTCLAPGKQLDLGRTHWLYCKTHRVKWKIGENLLTVGTCEEEQRERCEALNFGSFREVEPFFLPRLQLDGLEEVDPNALLRGLFVAIGQWPLSKILRGHVSIPDFRGRRIPGAWPTDQVSR